MTLLLPQINETESREILTGRRVQTFLPWRTQSANVFNSMFFIEYFQGITMGKKGENDIHRVK